MRHQPLSVFKSLHSIATENLIPLYGTIELTTFCNLKCQHCYNFDRSMTSPPVKHLEQKLIKELILDFKKLGGLMLAFSGGEALMHPNFFELLSFTRSQNLSVRLKSNGAIITSDIALKLNELELMDAEISLYGYQALEHNFITTIENSFEKTIQGITNLRKQNIPVQINFIVHKKNYRSIDQMKILAENLDCQYSFTTDITKRYDNSDCREELKIGHDEITFILKNNPDFFPASGKYESYTCACAKTVFGVASNGDVYPCIGAPIISGNLYHESFESIWRNSIEFNKIRQLENSDFKNCQTCDLNESCDRSSGSAFSNHGQYTGCDQSAKEIALIKSLEF